MKLLSYWRSLFWSVFMLLAFTIPASSMPSVSKFYFPHFDKVVHFALFGVLTLLLLYETRSLKPSANVFAAKGTLYASAISLFYALAIEGLQLYFIPTRTVSLADLGANLLGIICAIVAFGFAKRKLSILKSRRRSID